MCHVPVFKDSSSMLLHLTHASSQRLSAGFYRSLCLQLGAALSTSLPGFFLIMIWVELGVISSVNILQCKTGQWYSGVAQEKKQKPSHQTSTVPIHYFVPLSVFELCEFIDTFWVFTKRIRVQDIILEFFCQKDTKPNFGIKSKSVKIEQIVTVLDVLPSYHLKCTEKKCLLKFLPL